MSKNKKNIKKPEEIEEELSEYSSSDNEEIEELSSEEDYSSNDEEGEDNSSDDEEEGEDNSSDNEEEGEDFVDKLLKKSQNEEIDEQYSDEEEEEMEDIPEYNFDERVILIKNLPTGFFDKQIFEYFSQIATVKSVYVPKHKRTGKPKGYGYVWFEEDGVAEVVAEQLDYMIIKDRTLRVIMKRDVPDSVRKSLIKFVGQKPKFTVILSKDEIQQMKGISKPKKTSHALKRNARKKQLAKKLEKFGINFKI